MITFCEIVLLDSSVWLTGILVPNYEHPLGFRAPKSEQIVLNHDGYKASKVKDGVRKSIDLTR